MPRRPPSNRGFVLPRRWTIRWGPTLGDVIRQLHDFERLIGEGLRQSVNSVLTVTDDLTGLNLGSGARVFRDKVAPYLRFRTIRGDDGVTVTENADNEHIDIVATITGANVGSGADVFRDKTGGDTLNFRGIEGTGGIVDSVNGDNVEIDGSAFPTSVVGLDGMDLDLTSQVITGRRSRQRAFLEPSADIIDQAGWGAIDEIDLYPQVDGLSFHSLVAPGASDTTEMHVRNRSELYGITLPHESASGTVLYRFACPQMLDYVLGPGESCFIKYASNAPARWWVTDRATGDSVAFESRAGLGALGRFLRIQYLTDESPPAPGVETELIFVPGRNEWIKVYLGTVVAPGYLHSEGALAVQFLRDAGEGGETAAAPIEAGFGGFNEVEAATGLPPGSLYASPLRSEVIPGDTPRILVTYGRNDSGGSSSTRIMRSDDGGVTWATGNFAAASQLGALCLIWTGTNVVAAFEDGTIEYSTDNGQTFSDASSPTGQPLRVPMSNGEGTVVLVAHGSGVYSTDNGVSWTASTFPISFTVRGGTYFAGTWYIFTADNDVLTSTDGITWADTGTVDLNCPGWETTTLLDTHRGLVVCGDYMVGLFVDDDTDDYYKKDFFWSRNGITWTRSWSFGEGPAIMGPLDDSPVVQLPWRVRVHCTSARTPAHTAPPWHQIMVVPATGYDGVGGFADAYIGPRDYGGQLFEQVITEATVGLDDPEPVGGAPGPGAVTDEFAPVAHVHDLGRRGADIASASTINLNTATGDYTHVTGTTTITTVTLADGLRREAVIVDGLTLEHSANLILRSGADETARAGSLWLFRGEGSGVVRAWELTRGASAGEFDWLHGGTSGTPDDEEFRIVGDTLLIAAETISAGNQGLAILSRMERGGFAHFARDGSPDESMEFRVGPPTNEVDYLSFPVLDQFSTTNAFNVEAITLDRSFPSANNDQGIHLSPDGHHMLTAYAGGDAIHQWYLQKHHDPETAILVYSFDVSSFDNAPTDACWGHDGTYVVWCGQQNDLIRVIELAEPWMLSTGTDSGAISSAPTDPLTVRVSDDGSFLYAGNATNIERFTWTAGDLGTVSSAESVNIVTTLTGLTAISRFDFSPGEEFLFVRITNTGPLFYLRKCQLASPGVITGLTTVHQSQDLSGIDTSWRGFCMSEDGQFAFFRANTVEQGIVRFNTHSLTEAVAYRAGFFPETYQLASGAIGVESPADTWQWAHTFAIGALPPSTTTVFRWIWEMAHEDPYGGVIPRLVNGVMQVTTDDAGDATTFRVSYDTATADPAASASGFEDAEIGSGSGFALSASNTPVFTVFANYVFAGEPHGGAIMTLDFVARRSVGWT